MRAIIQIEGTLPESGVYVIREGHMVRLFFDLIPAEDGYACNNVDVPLPATYGRVVGAIIADSYTADMREAIISNYEEAKDQTSGISDEKRKEYIAEYNDFQLYRKKAKQIARLIL